MLLTKELQRDVFVACHSTFASGNASIRKAKTIRQRLEASPNPAIRRLVTKNSLATITEIVRDLLDREIFASDGRAKIEFPEVFGRPAAGRAVPITAPTQPKKAEATATNSTPKPSSEKPVVVELHTPPNPVQGRLKGPVLNASTPDLVERPLPSSALSVPAPTPSPTATVPDTNPGLPLTLPPTSLSFPTQHHILTVVQALLEQACFDFSTYNLPDLLTRKSWDCAQAAELTMWLRAIHEHFPNLTPRVSSTEAEFQKTYIPAAERLRHAVVHREPMTALALLALLRSCGKVAAALHDTATAAKIATLEGKLERVAAELDNTKVSLEDGLQKRLKRIAEQARLLMREQDEAVKQMAADAQRAKAEVSEGLERRIEDIFGEGKEKDKARSASVSTVVDEGDGLDGRAEGEGRHKEKEVQIGDGEDLICCEGEEVKEMGGGHVFIAF